MFSRPVALAALLLIPTFADAQKTNRGTKILSDWNKPDTNMGRAAPSYKKSDVEKFSAVLIVVDKKKDLKLTDDQVAKFKDLGKAEEAYNEPFYVKMDSARLAIRRRPGEDADQEKARMTLARQEMMNVIRRIRSNYDSVFQQGMPLLDETQKKTASEIVEKERADAEDDLRSKLGGGGGGGSSRRRP